jgi:protein-L-isoaspartate O-methyltransferase
MKLAKYLAIKSEYERFYYDLLSSGRLPLKDTGHGYWAMAVADDVYELFKRLKLQEYKKFIDIGSGDGKVALIASLFTNATGVEIDEELHNKATEISRKLKLRSRLVHGDYHELDLAAYDVIFYHPDHHNHKLELKLMKELQGKLIVYGGLYHPTNLQREMHFIANSTPVTIFSRKEHEL